MWKKIIVGSAMAIFAQASFAEEVNCSSVSANNSYPDKLAQCQAHSFINIYASTCLKYLTDLDILRQKLAPLPKLPPEKAEKFLGDREGDAWPVPDKYGLFVLSIPKDKNICLVYGRRANTETVKQEFTRIVAQAPAPLMVKQKTNKNEKTVPNGMVNTVAYEWSLPSNSPRKMLFMLSTAPLETAELQVIGSASMVRD